MKSNIKKLIKSLRDFSFSKECYKTEIGYLKIYKYEASKIKMPETENPYLYLVIDVGLRLYTPYGIMDYISGQYSIFEMDMPNFGYVISFSEHGDFLALSIEFTVDYIISVMIELNENLIRKVMNLELSNESMVNADNNVVKSVSNLLSITKEKEQLEFLEKHIKKEIIFNCICGSCGKNSYKVL